MKRMVSTGLSIFILSAASIAAAGSWDQHRPDVASLQAALDDLDDDDPAAALAHLRQASRYANKAAQAIIGELYWSGQGVATDRALAYAWSDLAAERGYEFLVLRREWYWAQLDEEEKARALEAGERLYAEFGDAVAKPRMEKLLRAGAREGTGSRIRPLGPVTVYRVDAKAMTDLHRIDSMSGYRMVDYYHPDDWDPIRYWRAQDQVWDRLSVAHGIVEVGPINDGSAR